MNKLNFLIKSTNLIAATFYSIMMRFFLFKLIDVHNSG